MVTHNYLEVQCPVCDIKFTADADIVVCPICGAPHHRDCYKNSGRCVFEDKHNNGEEWQRPVTEKRTGIYDSLEQLKCPKCNAVNPIQGEYCMKCGSAINDNQRNAGTNELAGESAQPVWGKPGQEQRTPPQPIWPNPYAAPFGGLAPEDEIEGISVRDLAVFVGENSHYYIPEFKKISSRGGLFNWNWSAFFFNFAYFFYRKMYAVGILALAIFIIPRIPFFIYLYQNIDFIREAAYQGSIDLLYSIYTGYEPSILDSFLSIIYYATLIILTGSANKLYYRFAVDSINNVKDDFSGEPHGVEYAFELNIRGGTNRNLAFISVIVLFFAFFMFSSYLVM